MEIGDDDFKGLSGGWNGVGKRLTILFTGYAWLADVRNVFLFFVIELDTLDLFAIYHLPDPTRASMAKATMK